MEGLGLGNGRQKKMYYLPYAHTDFIFPMIGEELGLRVKSAQSSFFLWVIIVCGIMIALHAKRSVSDCSWVAELFLCLACKPP